MDVLVVGSHSTRAEIEQAIAALRAKAKRYSRKDPRRDEIDGEVDRLVEEWIARNNTPPVIGGRECYQPPKGPPGVDSKEMGGEYRTLRSISAEAATTSVLRDD